MGPGDQMRKSVFSRALLSASIVASGEHVSRLGLEFETLGDDCFHYLTQAAEQRNRPVGRWVRVVRLMGLA